MKKKLLKEFREVAKVFPKTYTPAKVRVTGAELLKHNPDKKDDKGKPLNPDTIYLMDGGTKNNHTRGLKKAFKRGGMKAVEEYVKQMASMNVDAKMQEAAQVAAARELPMSITNREQQFIPAGF